MRRFSQRFCSPGQVLFLAADNSASKSGVVGPHYPDPSAGVLVSASVQPDGTDRQVLADGSVRHQSHFFVVMLDNPRLLNGGLGIRRDDGFYWDLDQHDGDPTGNRLMIAQGDAERVGSVWRVRCTAFQ